MLQYGNVAADKRRGNVVGQVVSEEKRFVGQHLTNSHFLCMCEKMVAFCVLETSHSIRAIHSVLPVQNHLTIITDRNLTTVAPRFNRNWFAAQFVAASFSAAAFRCASHLVCSASDFACLECYSAIFRPMHPVIQGH